jgi:CspA family cold shock protein
LDGNGIVRGHVKWFDATKGFGFVVADEGGADILLHANVLRNFGQSSIADGSLVEIRVQRTDRGMQATEVLSIEAPRDIGAAPTVDMPDLPEVGPDVPLVPARVKWFDKVKGFGFANVFGRPEDVFIHMEVLRACGMADLLPGEAVCLRVVEGPRGRMAAEVRSWEFGLRSSD